MASSPLLSQISNRNFLNPSGFKFILSNKPKVDFFCSEANLPGINLGVAVQSTYLKDIPIPGDKLSYDDFSLKFIVDENMENYVTVHNWLRGFGYPESVYEYQQLLDEDEQNPGKQTAYSGQTDGELIVYNSNFNPVAKINFKGLFPVSLTTIPFNSQVNSADYVTAEVVFKYTIYDITIIEEYVAPVVTYKKPTVEFTATELIIEEGASSILNWTVTDAYDVVITSSYGSNIGTVNLTGSNRVSPDASITYTITAKGKGGTTTKSLTIGVLPNSANRTCIAVVDENLGSQTFAGMESKWTTFRSNWPNRKFYLLQPGGQNYGSSIDALHLPTSFLEETDAATVSIP